MQRKKSRRIDAGSVQSEGIDQGGTDERDSDTVLCKQLAAGRVLLGAHCCEHLCDLILSITRIAAGASEPAPNRNSHQSQRTPNFPVPATPTGGLLTMTAATTRSGHAPEAQRLDPSSRNGCALYGPYPLQSYARHNARNGQSLCILIAPLGKDRIPCDWDRDRAIRTGALRPICPVGSRSRSDKKPRLGRNAGCLIRRDWTLAASRA